ncbi:hypothetical protein [Nocardia sp. CNY236]|uniref:hypothetical protein n=1 Tax=Nocardia sp. CNY236 TaxID=1169152 RepID=UPI0004260DE8|nr:hypothetical protein [Nocardia sp. CNY236]
MQHCEAISTRDFLPGHDVRAMQDRARDIEFYLANGLRMGSASLLAGLDPCDLAHHLGGLGYQVITAGPATHEITAAVARALTGLRPLQYGPSTVVVVTVDKGHGVPKRIAGQQVAQTPRVHKVPLRNPWADNAEFAALERWLSGYRPQELFTSGAPSPTVRRGLAPAATRRVELHAPRGCIAAASAVADQVAGADFGAAITTTLRELNTVYGLRVFSPDELASNRIELGATDSGWTIEVLNEELCHAWAQGYQATGRRGVVVGYEAFAPITASLLAQQLLAHRLAAAAGRPPGPSLVYLLTSLGWHNTITHANPGLIDIAVGSADPSVRVVRSWMCRYRRRAVGRVAVTAVVARVSSRAAMSPWTCNVGAESLFIRFDEIWPASCREGGRIGSIFDNNLPLPTAGITCLPEHVLAQLEIVDICGAYGDPAIAGELLDICHHIHTTNPGTAIRIYTNGGLRTPNWWARLAEIPGITTIFAIDGLATNGVYRRKVDIDKVLANAAAFIDAGGRAQWDYIAFAHNEHKSNPPAPLNSDSPSSASRRPPASCGPCMNPPPNCVPVTASTPPRSTTAPARPSGNCGHRPTNRSSTRSCSGRAVSRSALSTSTSSSTPAPSSARPWIRAPSSSRRPDMCTRAAGSTSKRPCPSCIVNKPPPTHRSTTCSPPPAEPPPSTPPATRSMKSSPANSSRPWNAAGAPTPSRAGNSRCARGSAEKGAAPTDVSSTARTSSPDHDRTQQTQPHRTARARSENPT